MQKKKLTAKRLDEILTKHQSFKLSKKELKRLQKIQDDKDLKELNNFLGMCIKG